MRRTVRTGFKTTVILVGLGFLATARAQEMAAKPQPERYSGIITVANAPERGIIHVRLTLERLSTDDERKTYVEAIKAKGSEGLAAAMEKVTVGYIQFEQNLRYPLAYAIKVPTENGEMIRVATNRPISYEERTDGFVSKEYSIGVMELKFPKDGPGEGAILAAAKVDFNEKGELEVRSLPQNTGPQRVSQIQREEVKAKKKKD